MMNRSIAALLPIAALSLVGVACVPSFDRPRPQSDRGPVLDGDAHVDVRRQETATPCYLQEDFEVGLGKLTSGGDVKVSGGTLQINSTASPSYAYFTPSVANYRAETQVTITEATTALARAGLGMRVPNPAAAAQAVGYFCMINLSPSRLELVRCAAPACSVLKSASTSVGVGAAARLVATAVGASISCALPDAGINLSANDSALTSGSVTLESGDARAAFAYFRTCPP